MRRVAFLLFVLFLVPGALRGGGLRVGQKLDLKKSRGEWVIKPVEREDKPGLFRFSPWMDDWSISYLVVDENGIITKIYNWTNDC
jgi:hypothetical protein